MIRHRYVGSDAQQRAAGTTHAVAAARRGEPVLLHADSAYALCTDAFSERGVAQLRTLKGSPQMSVPVLIGEIDVIDGLLALPGPAGQAARTLIRACWPGPLTIVGQPHASLMWAAGGNGTVAVRMPLHPWTLEVVRTLGPTACVGAGRAGQPAPTTADAAADMWGEDVHVLLDGGAAPANQASTVVDVSGAEWRIVREGAFSADYLRTLLND